MIFLCFVKSLLCRAPRLAFSGDFVTFFTQLFGATIWRNYLAQLFGATIWCNYLDYATIWTMQLFGLCNYLVQLFGHLFGATIWRNYLMQLFGATI
jgi:hypothetical protein